MATLALTAKRQATALAYKIWTNSVTGSMPTSHNLDDGVEIILTPVQITAMKNSMLESMAAERSPNDLNVSYPWGAILIPLVFEKYWPYMAGGALGLMLTGYLIKR